MRVEHSCAIENHRVAAESGPAHSIAHRSVDIGRAEWLEHIRPEINLAAVRQAAEDHRLSGERLDHAVAGARAGGASWTDIGRAAGVARQTAHERWKALSHSVD